MRHVWRPGRITDAYTEVSRISNLVSFEPDIVTVHLDGAQLHLEPGQEVIPHGPDRNLTVDEAMRPAHLRERAPAGLVAAAKRLATRATWLGYYL